MPISSTTRKEAPKPHGKAKDVPVVAPIPRKQFRAFNSFWTHEIDPGRVQLLLTDASVSRPTRYNQLMVAYDQVQAVYQIWGSGGHVKNGAPYNDAGTPFDLLFDNGNIPSQFSL